MFVSQFAEFLSNLILSPSIFWEVKSETWNSWLCIFSKLIKIKGKRNCKMEKVNLCRVAPFTGTIIRHQLWQQVPRLRDATFKFLSGSRTVCPVPTKVKWTSFDVKALLWHFTLWGSASQISILMAKALSKAFCTLSNRSVNAMVTLFRICFPSGVPSALEKSHNVVTQCG